MRGAKPLMPAVQAGHQLPVLPDRPWDNVMMLAAGRQYRFSSWTVASRQDCVVCRRQRTLSQPQGRIGRSELASTRIMRVDRLAPHRTQP